MVTSCTLHRGTFFTCCSHQHNVTYKWWFTALAVSGIFAGFTTFSAFIHIGYVGVGCYALTTWVIAATSFGVVAWRMSAKNILRWWHVVLVFAIGGSLFINQTGVMWPICIPGPEFHEVNLRMGMRP